MITLALSLALALQAGDSRWTVLDETSALDGEQSYLAGIESESPVTSAIGRQTLALLSVSCQGNRKRVAIVWPAYLGLDEAHVRWRFDHGEIQEGVFYVMRGGRNAYLEGRAADRFLGEMGQSGQVVVQVSGHRDRQETTFVLTGADEHISAVRAGCSR